MFRDAQRPDSEPEPSDERTLVRFDVTPDPQAGDVSRQRESLREWLDGYRSSPVGSTRSER